MLFLTTILSICTAAITWKSALAYSEGNCKGKHAALGEFGYIVSLQIDGSHYCTGTILSDRWVLTAAHCLWWYTPATFSTGSNLLSKLQDEYLIDQVVIHPDFHTGVTYHDIALFKSLKPIRFTDNVSKARLPNRRVEVGALVSSPGWGGTGKESKLTDQLFYFNTTVIDQKKCRKALRDKLFITDDDFCTYKGERWGICRGDVGGPLVDSETKQVLYGVTSRSARSYPDIFVEVYPYIRWIKSIIH